MTTCISLLRHGEVDNPQEVYYGRLPGFGLSAEGRRQAQHAGLTIYNAVVNAQDSRRP